MSAYSTAPLTLQLQQLGKACKGDGMTLSTLQDLFVLLMDHSTQQTQLLSLVFDVAVCAVEELQVCLQMFVTRVVVITDVIIDRGEGRCIAAFLCLTSKHLDTLHMHGTESNKPYTNKASADTQFQSRTRIPTLSCDLFGTAFCSIDRLILTQCHLQSDPLSRRNVCHIDQSGSHSFKQNS